MSLAKLSRYFLGTLIGYLSKSKQFLYIYYLEFYFYCADSK